MCIVHLLLLMTDRVSDCLRLPGAFSEIGLQSIYLLAGVLRFFGSAHTQ